MSKPQLVRYSNSTGTGTKSIDCTGGNLLVVKLTRGGSSGISWGSQTYDSEQLPIIYTVTGFNTHARAVYLEDPPQEEVDVVVSQSSAESLVVHLEVYSGVDLQTVYEDVVVHVRNEDFLSIVHEEVGEHHLVSCFGIGGNLDRTWSNATRHSAVNPSGQSWSDAATSEDDGEDVTVSISPVGTDSGARLVSFLLVGEESGVSVEGEGELSAGASTVAGSGSAYTAISGTGALSAQAVALAGSGVVLNVRNLVLTQAQGRELRDEGGTPVDLDGIIYEWYDDPDSTEGEPADSGTFNTDENGEATVVLSNSSLTDGHVGGLLLIHPSDPTIRGYYRVPVTLSQ